MSYRHTIEASLESLHEIEDLIKGFPSGGKIPSVEIDLALQKLRNVYELMLMMRGKETGELVMPERKDKEKPVVEQVIRKDEVIATEETTVERTVETTVEVVVEKKEQASKKVRSEKNVETLADHYKGTTTLLESLHKNYNNESEMSTHVMPVSDLMKAIGINDRFTFVRELFANDHTAFEQAIRELNNSASFNDAYNYMIQQYNWDMDGEPVQLLLDIIRRKYIKGRHE